MTRPSVLDLIRRSKAKGWTVVLGGPEAANYPDEYVGQGADVVVEGEGERTMAELLPALAERGPHRLHGVPGTIFRDEDGRLVHNPAREQIEEIDFLPWPDRGQIDLPRYVDVWREHHGMGSVNLITARGCPYRCRWCSHAVFGFTHRRRSVQDCANELEHIRETYRPDQVWYADDVFTIHHRWLFEYAAELKRRGLRIPFETISRADRMMKDEVLATLAEMGCYRIWIGSESGSQRDPRRHGPRGHARAGAVGLPGSPSPRHPGGHVPHVGLRRRDHRGHRGHDRSREEERSRLFLTTVAYPIKNTAYYHEVAERVVPSRSWAEGSDRDHAVRGRHSRIYYKHADQWLREEVEAFRLREKDPARASDLRDAAARSREALLAAAGEIEA